MNARYNKTEEFIKKYPEYENDLLFIEWIFDRFDNNNNGNVNNFRVANLKNHEQMKEYVEQIERGCCGSIDELLQGDSGRWYLLGCNYGH